MKKEILLAVISTFVIAGLTGFYGGRLYEKKVFRKQFTQMRQNGGQNQMQRDVFFMDGEKRGGPPPSQPLNNGAVDTAPKSQ